MDEEILARLSLGKEQLRRKRIAMTLPEKIRQIVELQKIVLPLIERQRPLEPWERVWDLGDDNE